MYLVLDIETFADEESLYYKEFRYLRDRIRENSEEKVIDQLSFNPFIACIISVSCAIFEPEEEGLALRNFKVFYLREEGYTDPPKEITVSYIGNPFTLELIPFEFKEPDIKDIENTEKKLLESFFNYVEDELSFIKGVVTYNGRNFDMSFLFIRSVIHGLTNPFVNNTNVGMIDLLEQISNPKKIQIKLSRYSLDFVANRLGFKAKFKISGKDVKELFKRGEYEEIAKYNAYDVIATAFLFKKLMPYIVEVPHERRNFNRAKFAENFTEKLKETVELWDRVIFENSEEDLKRKIEAISKEGDLIEAVKGLLKVEKILKSILES